MEVVRLRMLRRTRLVRRNDCCFLISTRSSIAKTEVVLEGYE